MEMSPIQIARRTPQGVRGLKRSDWASLPEKDLSHSARSAWIETIETNPHFFPAVVALRKECVD